MPEPSISEIEARLEAACSADADPAARVDVQLELAWAIRNEDTPRAHVLATEARDLAMACGYKLGQARAARTMAMTPGSAENLLALLELAEEAMHLFDEVGDGEGRAGSRDFLASLHEHVGDLAGGMALALDALTIAREIDDPVRQGYALSNIGGILAASGEVDEAVERLQEALGLFEDAQDLQGAGTITSRLAQILKDAGRNDESLAYARRCRDIAEAIDSEYSKFSALSVMGQLEEDGGDPGEAERFYRAALACLENPLGKTVMGAEVQVSLGRLLTREGKLEAAELELTDILARSEEHPFTIQARASGNEALADLYERLGKLALAIKHLRQARDLRESIARRDARNKSAQIEARVAMEAARKDAEIHRLRYVELHAVQSKLVEAEKMALLGKLAAGMAHELNTPLGVLRSNAELSASAARRLVALMRGGEEPGPRAEKMAAALESCRDTSDEAVERIHAIAQSFRRFTQLDLAERRTFDPREGLQGALALLAPNISEQITLEFRLDEVPRIEGWPRELNHAFLTVLQNAVQAIDQAGVVTVETSADDEQVLVRVRDTGRGMSEEQASRLFDVTWSEEGARTRMRLGLSAAYTTMQKHGGDMSVDSAPGQGTTVTFRFPRP